MKPHQDSNPLKPFTNAKPTNRNLTNRDIYQTLRRNLSPALIATDGGHTRGTNTHTSSTAVFSTLPRLPKENSTPTHALLRANVLPLCIRSRHLPLTAGDLSAHINTAELDGIHLSHSLLDPNYPTICITDSNVSFQLISKLVQSDVTLRPSVRGLLRNELTGFGTHVATAVLDSLRHITTHNTITNDTPQVHPTTQLIRDRTTMFVTEMTRERIPVIQLHPSLHIYLCHVNSHCLTKAGNVKTDFLNTKVERLKALYHCNYYADMVCGNMTTQTNPQSPPTPSLP
jgi:hypothetical protein